MWGVVGVVALGDRWGQRHTAGAGLSRLTRKLRGQLRSEGTTSTLLVPPKVMPNIDKGTRWKRINYPRLPRAIALAGAAAMVLGACGLVPVPGGPDNTVVWSAADLTGTWKAADAGGFVLTSDGRFVATSVPSRIFAGILSDGLTVPDVPGVSSGYGTWRIVNDVVRSAIVLTPGAGVGPAGGELIIYGDRSHFVLCVLYQSGPCAVSYTRVSGSALSEESAAPQSRQTGWSRAVKTEEPRGRERSSCRSQNSRLA